tara:strand:- start:116 stop:382 length:267 start_codon:yes stop_codon:yes gene_type:complete
MAEERKNDVKKEVNYVQQIYSLQKDLEFYKSVFETHNNSALFNLRIKTINGERVWVDKIKAFTDYELLEKLDKDDEVLEWMKPIPCER